MDIGTISSRYAKALFSLAKEKGLETRVYDDMKMLADSFSLEPGLRVAFSFSSRIRRAASSTCKRVSAAAFRKAYIDNSLETARQANEQLANIQAEGARILAEAKEKQNAILKEAFAEKEQIIDEAHRKAAAETRFKRVVDVGFPLFHCLDDDRKSVFGDRKSVV